MRAIGTCVTLIRAHHTTAIANLVVPLSQTSLLPLSSTAATAATAATVSGENSVVPLLESFDGTAMQAVSPKSSRQSRNTSSPDSDGVHSSPVKVGGVAVYPVATEMVGGAGSYIVGAAGVLSSTVSPLYVRCTHMHMYLRYSTFHFGIKLQALITLNLKLLHN